MAQFKIDNISNVYWAYNDGIKSGRDPMGIQNSSIATYGVLLPGMTNLTGHIRYYSFYCWILKEYDELENSKGTSIHQYNFIRRAELIMAFIMSGRNLNAVIGSDFVANNNFEEVNPGIVNIASGADYNSRGNKYWAYTTGAFGQYYLGSLAYFNLVKVEENRFYLRDRGKELARAFCESVNISIRNEYINYIIDGVFDTSRTKAFEAICLNNIKSENEEWQFLNNMLFNSDDNSLREQSIRLFLETNEDKFSINSFPEKMFKKPDAFNESETALFGWAYYYLCETLHFSIESILWLILERAFTNPLINEFLQECSGNIYQKLNIEEDIELSYFVSNQDKKICDLRDLIVNEKEAIKAASIAINIICRSHKLVQNIKDKINSFEIKYDIKRQRGCVSDIMENYIEKHKDLSMKDYLREILRQVMSEHTIIACNKMGANNSEMRKFMIEDGKLVLVEMRKPQFTNPRLSSLRYFLMDLGYISSTYQLTEIASNYLNKK